MPNALDVLAESTRFRILKSLAICKRHVTDLASILDLPVANLSHHLAALSASGYVISVRQGRYVIYSLNPKIFAESSSEKLVLQLQVGGAPARLEVTLTKPEPVPMWPAS